MYQDTGNPPSVTCGVGHRILGPEELPSLPFEPPANPSDYSRVLTAKRLQFATYYKDLTSCRLNNAGIDQILDKDVRSFVDQLTKKLPQMVDWPINVQEGCVDMAYNLGIAGFMKYGNLIKACNAGDWTTAAKDSFRHGFGDTPERMGSRNQKTYNLFVGS
jgi:hypothetical protein